MLKYSLYITFVSLFFFSCVSSPDYSDVPEINFISLSKSSLEQSSVSNDELFLNFSFTDGDGDIGESATNGNSNLNVTLIDNRTGEIYDRYKTPEIPQQGTGNGIDGEIRILVLTTCCVFPAVDSIPPCEKPAQYPTNDLSFDIQISDRAGNKSNIITTPVITLLCN